ncbi:MAG: hypothetical protein PVG22_17190, partial [Chromatiales bacterium]|jgi:hypothetical protein
VVLATLSTGALVGMFTVLENRRPHALSHRIKTALKRLHIMFAWPIPALLVIHLVSVYYF